MNIGQLRRHIELRHLTPTTGDTGQPISGYVTYATVHAKVESVTTEETTVEKENRAYRHYNITIRYRSDLLSTDAVWYDNHLLQISGIPQADERKRQLEFVAIQAGD